jgi:hypothetical protein
VSPFQAKMDILDAIINRSVGVEEPALKCQDARRRLLMNGGRRRDTRRRTPHVTASCLDHSSLPTALNSIS